MRISLSDHSLLSLQAGSTLRASRWMRASTTAETVACQLLRPSASILALMALPPICSRVPLQMSPSEQCQVHCPAEPCCVEVFG